MLQKAFISDIDAEIITLNQAIRDHFAWANRLIEFCLCDEVIDSSYTDKQAHHFCAFGYWLRLQLSNAQDNESMMRAIEATHEIMHDAMRNLINAINEQQNIRENLNNFFHAQMHFLQATDDYKTSLISLRNCYDALTGLPLRQLLYKDLARLTHFRQRKNGTIYLSLIDIDKFKSINDTWGHNVGDMILKELGQLVSVSIRNSDRAYRFGGEEFILLQECQSYQDYRLAIGRIIHLIRTHTFIIPDGAINITVTCGTATIIENEPLQVIIDRADKAMYFGKQNGRDQCLLWTENKMINIEKRTVDNSAVDNNVA
ncbi:diguanylate cyclase [Atlantibacter sp.]|uniref:diguanylate cyclase n=1 Tax=Atlantibacter sp. TaxID=1903473 RepID=UPI0028AD1937|nr:diguanylate cyclase [Atlantibacter sp.]